MSVSIEEHRAALNALVHRLRPVRLPVDEALGTVLAEDVTAAIPVPPFTNSAMDGFAIRHADLQAGADRPSLPIAGDAPNEAAGPEIGPKVLPVVGDVPAGDTRRRELPSGTAIRIMTGAPLPVGADTVVKVEDTDHVGGRLEVPAAVRIETTPTPGANVRREGEAVQLGETLLCARRLLSAVDISAAAAAGVGRVTAIPRPRVIVVATGAELAPPGDLLGWGQIPDSNGLLMEGLVREAGYDVVARLRTSDDISQFRGALADAPDADLVVTAGGISEGAYEVVRLALGDSGVFHHVAQQPGGPQGYGTIAVAGRDVPVVCLPGNPVSVFTSFHVYCKGLLARMAGREYEAEPRAARLRVAQGWDSPRNKVQFMPVRITENGVVPAHPLGSKSHLVTSLPEVDGLAMVGVDRAMVREGEQIPVIPTTRRGL